MLRKIIILALVFVGNVEAQVSQSSVDFIKNFKFNEEEFPRERIYLHTDRDWYFFGDRIWFSAYVTAGPYNFYSDMSKVLYVEFYAPNGDMIERVSVEITEGRGQGSLSFEDVRRREGKYRIKAYTAWSLNFGESYTFTKDFPVLVDRPIENEVSSVRDFDVQFFPESGWLIEDVPTRIGFKAIKEDGFGFDVEGKVISGNSEVATIKSEHLGMGFFELTPESGSSYYAEINGEKFDLPIVVSEGTALKIDQDSSKFTLTVHSKVSDDITSILAFAHVRGEVFSAEMVPLVDGFGSISINKEQFPTGVIHFTLINRDGYPEAERLVFNRNEIDELKLSAQLTNESTPLREQNSFRLRLIDGYDEIVSGTASLSIFDDQPYTYEPYKSTIATRLYLETELRGYVEYPGYYFSNEHNAAEYADLLMLTQGWRAYDMSSIKDLESVELFSFPEKGFTISGRIKGGFFGKSQRNAPVFFSLGETEQATLVTADEDGRFVIDGLNIQGVQPFEIKANSESGKSNVDIEIDSQFEYLPEDDENVVQSMSGNKLASSDVTMTSTPVTETEIEEDVLERVQSAQEEAELFIEAQMELELDEITVTSDRLAYSEAVESNDYATQIVKNTTGRSATLNVQDYEYTDQLRTADLINQLPGVTVNNNRIFIQRIGLNTSFLNTPEPLVLLNGSVTSFNLILGMEPEDIESITVLRSDVDLAIFGAQALGGALVVEAKRGERYLGQRGLIQGRIGGYQIPAEFYMPRYGVTVPRELDKEDNRVTLFWEPIIDVSRRGVQLQFWANDVASTYRLVLEGITELGTPFYHTEVFTIKED